jgi:hypothetical protein
MRLLSGQSFTGIPDPKELTSEQMKQAHLFSFLSSLLFLGVFADVAIHLI